MEFMYISNIFFALIHDKKVPDFVETEVLHTTAKPGTKVVHLEKKKVYE